MAALLRRAKPGVALLLGEVGEVWAGRGLYPALGEDVPAGFGCDVGAHMVVLGIKVAGILCANFLRGFL